MQQHKDNVHDGVRAFQCSFCPQTCTQASALKTHIRRKHSDGKVIFPLPLEVHIEESIKEGKIPCQYELCGKSFASKQRLKSHVEAVHEGKKLSVERLNCDLCDKSFASKQRLNSHIATIHEFDVRAFQCSFCPQTCTQEQALKNHIKRKHSDGKVFIPLPLNVQIEETINEGKEPCFLCGKGFASKQRLKTHVEAVHEGKKLLVDRHNCDLCDKSFWSKKRLKSHVVSIHEFDIEVPDSDNVPDSNEPKVTEYKVEPEEEDSNHFILPFVGLYEQSENGHEESVLGQ